MANLSQKVGFIGAGRMATALARGCVESGLVAGNQVLAADPHPAAHEAFASQVAGAELTTDNDEVLGKADLIVLAVKPQVLPEILNSISNSVQPRHLIISIAAGIRLEKFTSLLPEKTRIVRVMPNTPCLVGQGVSCFSLGQHATEEDGRVVAQILESVGSAYQVEESMLDAVTGLSGSGPAFVYTVIEALTEGGLAEGLPEDIASALAAQTVLGAAEMVLATGKSPEELRNQVTSPGGTTLAGLEALKQLKGAEALQGAVRAATKRSIELGES